MADKVALITGIGGQDGWYLAQHLNRMGYTVHGTTRSGDRSIAGCRAVIHHADMLDVAALAKVVRNVQPDEIYNLASQSSVFQSWESPAHSISVNGCSVAALLESVLTNCPSARVFQAGSGEQFAGDPDSPQNEQCGFSPRSPYGAAKTLASHVVDLFRRSYGMFCCTGYLYNHESPRRPERFVSRRISKAVAAIKHDRKRSLKLFDLTVVRDWGFAGDYVQAMHLMLQQEYPRDLVIASGRGASVWDFTVAAFLAAGMDESDARAHVTGDSGKSYVPHGSPLVGDPTLAKLTIGWSAEMPFDELAALMVRHDLGNA